MSEGTVVIIELMGGKIPEKATPGSACHDLFYAGPDVTLYPGNSAKLQLGFKLHLAEGWEAQIRGRSGLAKKGLIVHPGTIDSDYRQEVSVLAYNPGSPISFKYGDRIAQMKISKVWKVEFWEGNVVPNNRGGFGSTGV